MPSRKNLSSITGDLEVGDLPDHLPLIRVSSGASSHSRNSYKHHDPDSSDDDERSSAGAVAVFPLVPVRQHSPQPQLQVRPQSQQQQNRGMNSSNNLASVSLPSLLPRQASNSLLTRQNLSASSMTTADWLSTARDYSTQDLSKPLDPSEVDWYGNSELHQLFARTPLDTVALATLLDQQPQLARHQNQFGRLPLHYALDRIRVDEAAVRLLLAAHPAAVAVADQQGHTPYSIAVRWQHNRTLLKMLLEACPDVDKDALLRLKYGPLGSFAVWASGLTGAATTSQSTNAHGDGDCDDDQDHSIDENALIHAKIMSKKESKLSPLKLSLSNLQLDAEVDKDSDVEDVKRKTDAGCTPRSVGSLLRKSPVRYVVDDEENDDVVDKVGFISDVKGDEVDELHPDSVQEFSVDN